MIKKIVRNIRRGIVLMFSSFFGEVQKEFKKSEWRKKAKQFKHLGNNCFIEYPYRINNAIKISIGDNFYASHHLRLEAFTNYGEQTFTPDIYIGNNVSMQSNCHIGAIGRIIIEDYVMMASNIYISDHFHGNISKDDIVKPPVQRLLTTRGDVIIKKNVWIGDSVCIMPGVCIGENTIVGANSVVTKSFPANVVIAGVPAKILKSLLD